MIFDGKRPSSDDVTAGAGRAAVNYLLLSLDKPDVGRHQSSIPIWQPPPLGVFKDDVDAAVI